MRAEYQSGNVREMGPSVLLPKLNPWFNPRLAPEGPDSNGWGGLGGCIPGRLAPGQTNLTPQHVTSPKSSPIDPREFFKLRGNEKLPLETPISKDVSTWQSGTKWQRFWAGAAYLASRMAQGALETSLIPPMMLPPEYRDPPWMKGGDA
jgi:hypothetical protein